MNCAGYLGSAKIALVEGLWKLTFIPETVSPDAQEKTAACKQPIDGGNNPAFAVAPRDSNRKNIKIGNVDTRKLYASLPDTKRKWLEEEKKIYKTNPEFRDREKGNLTLRQDDWTDTDGDGKIDLVSISAVCEKGDSEGTSCSSILMLIDGKWIKVGLT